MPAIVNIKSTRNVASAVGYASAYGGKAKAHNGYDMRRVLCQSGVNCTPQNGLKLMMDRVKRKQFLQNLKPKPRKIVQAYTLIQSFDASFDYKNIDDVKKVNQLGQKLVGQVVPNKLALIFTQADGKNHILHNHIIVCSLSENLKAMSGKQTNFRTWAKANDEVLKAEGLETLAPVSSKPTAKEHLTRAEIAINDKGQKTRTELIKEKIEEIEQDPTVIDFDSFVEVAKKHDLDVHVRRNKKKEINGLSYKLLDPKIGMKRGIRAKRLGSNYMKEALYDVFEANSKRKRLIKQREARIEAGRSSATAETSDLGAVQEANLRFALPKQSEIDHRQGNSTARTRAIGQSVNSEFRRAVTPSNRQSQKDNNFDFFQFTRRFGNNERKHKRFDEYLKRFVAYRHKLDEIRAEQLVQEQRANTIALLSHVELDRELAESAGYKQTNPKCVEIKRQTNVIKPEPKPKLITKYGYTLKPEYSDYADMLSNPDMADMQYILHPEWFVKPEKPEQSANPKPPTPQKQQDQDFDDDW